MKMNILAIVPYEGMQAIIREAQKSDPSVCVDIVVGTYEDYIQIAHTIDILKYDYIFARGYTAQMLKPTSMVPVAEIRISLYDMLRVITMAKRRNVPFAILGSSNILEIAHQVIDILQYRDIHTYAIESEAEADRRTAELICQGVRLIVGDVYAVNAASRAGISSILITSSLSSIQQALQDAVESYQQHARVYERLKLMTQIIQENMFSVIVCDSSERVVFSNLANLQTPPQPLKKLLQRAQTKLRERDEPVSCISQSADTILRIDGRRLNLDDCYYAFYVQTKKAPPTMLKQHIYITCPSEEHRTLVESKLYVLPPKLLSPDTARLSANTPTVIVGDIGTGKELLAEYLWCAGSFSQVPLVCLDCTAIDRHALEQIISDANSPLYEPQLVLLIKNLHLLPPECQTTLCQFLEETSFSIHHPLIVTSTAAPATLLAQQKLFFKLCDYLLGNHIYIENLNQRPENLQAIIDVLINKYNLELGKEAIGVTPEGMKALQGFRWHSNINQLKAVIRQLVLSSSQHYISEQQVSRLLSATEREESAAGSIDLTGTLEDITQRVAEQILQQEGMNYSSAAKRLGISRSTLYRKLKGN